MNLRVLFVFQSNELHFESSRLNFLNPENMFMRYFIRLGRIMDAFPYRETVIQVMLESENDSAKTHTLQAHIAEG